MGTTPMGGHAAASTQNSVTPGGANFLQSPSPTQTTHTRLLVSQTGVGMLHCAFVVQVAGPDPGKVPGKGFGGGVTAMVDVPSEPCSSEQAIAANQANPIAPPKTNRVRRKPLICGLVSMVSSFPGSR
jgi:hypothetical protein